MGEYPNRDYLMYSLPFRLAGRLEDGLRDGLGEDAAAGEIELPCSCRCLRRATPQGSVDR